MVIWWGLFFVVLFILYFRIILVEVLLMFSGRDYVGR